MRYILPTKKDLFRAYVYTGWQLCKTVAGAMLLGAVMGLGAFWVFVG